jgi:prepilin-type N-terminal cleavage/methylation domain-containing protein
MSTLGRRGFTLVELLIALVLLGIVTAGIYRTLATNQRTYQAQTQRIGLQENMRTALSILPGEFRELNAVDGDILGMGPDSIRIRAMRQFAVVCDRPPLTPPPGPFQTNVVVATTMTVRAAPHLYQGSRAFDAARDDVFVYYEGDERSRLDDGWVLGDITATAPQACPDARAGERLSVTLTFLPLPAPATQINARGAIPNGAPVRGFETVTYLRYQDADGRYYVGMRIAGVLRQLIGPVTANGLTLRYYDAAGAETAVPAQVASIGITVRAETAQPISAPGGGGVAVRTDSIVTMVALRNNRRF